MGDWKLIERYEHGNLELYNLKDDVGETTNLADSMPDRAGAMRARLDRWRKQVDAKMPPANPDALPAE
jgi:hypothetical protein